MLKKNPNRVNFNPATTLRTTTGNSTVSDIPVKLFSQIHIIGLVKYISLTFHFRPVTLTQQTPALNNEKITFVKIDKGRNTNTKKKAKYQSLLQL